MNFNHTMVYRCHVWCSLIISCHKIKSKWQIECKKKRQYSSWNIETDTIRFLLNFLENFLETLFTPLFSDVPFSFPNVKPLIFWGSKAQFKRRSFHELNLIPIKVDPNDTSLMVHSDVELCWSDSIHFHDVQWSKILQEKINFGNLCIRFGAWEFWRL